jgi:hypothetical protein
LRRRHRSYRASLHFRGLTTASLGRHAKCAAASLEGADVALFPIPAASRPMALFAPQCLQGIIPDPRHASGDATARMMCAGKRT